MLAVFFFFLSYIDNASKKINGTSKTGVWLRLRVLGSGPNRYFAAGLARLKSVQEGEHTESTRKPESDVLF